MRLLPLALVAAVALSAAPLLSQPLPLGPEILVTPDPVLTADLAANQDGSFGIDVLTRGWFFTAADTLAGFTDKNPWIATRGNGYVDIRHHRQDGRHQIRARLLDAAGQPVSPEILLVEDGQVWHLAGDPAGGFFVGWKVSSQLGLSVRRFDALGSPAGPIVQVPEPQTRDLAPLPGGGFAVAGVEHGHSSSDVFVRAYRPDGAPAGLKTLAAGIRMGTSDVRITADSLGRIVAVWSMLSPEGGMKLLAERLDASGQPLGPAFLVSETTPGSNRGFSWEHDAAARPDGSFLILWGETDLIVCGGPGVDWCSGRLPDDNGDTWARAYDAAGSPLGPAFLVSDETERHQEPGQVAAFPGGWIASWTTTAGPAPGLRVRRIFSPGCGGTAPALCLQSRRFRAEVAWRVPATGASGTGAPIPFADDSGAFWFFSPANQELVVKVLDGRGVNGHFWVFFGSVTDVEFDLTITDTLTGQRRIYHNPAGTMASRADTEAF